MGNDYLYQIRLSEFALYSADGVRRNVGLVVNSVSSAKELGEGEVAYLAGSDIYANYDGTYGGRANGISSLFDEVHGTAVATSGCDWYCSTPGSKSFDPEDSSTWVVVVMRLPATTPEIVALDYVSSFNSNITWHKTEPRTYVLESSPDGVNWHEVYKEDDAGSHHKARGGYWISSSASSTANANEAFAPGAVRKLSDGKGLAFANRAATADSHPTALSSVAGIKVAGGAALSLVGDVAPVAKMTVDLADGMGSISGLTLAESGTLDILGAATPFTGTNIVVDWSGVANPDVLERWTLQMNGRIRSCPVRVTDEGLSILPPGLTIIVR